MNASPHEHPSYGRRAFATGLVVLAGVAVAAGCGKKDSTGGNGNIPAGLQTSLEEAFGRSPSVIDGFQRLFVAAAGGPADGVVLNVNGNVVDAAVLIDYDGDGNRETTITGSAIFSSAALDLTQGATLSFSGPPGSMKSAYGQAFDDGAGNAVIDQVGGDFVSGSTGTETILTGGTLTMNLATGQPSGVVDFETFSSADPIFGTIHVEDDGQGGFQLRITGAGDSFEFIIR
ncbi:MAG: hypothetical protein AB7I33_16015 [Gemmatimonadales bacterium]